jgi:GDPmannose 4,6-dehydratase
MYLILQQESPDDYVISTGITTEVREFVNLSFAELGIELEFIGEGKEEIGVIKSFSKENKYLKVGQEIIAVDPNYFRPTEVELLIGDSSKAKEKLGWIPEYNLQDLVADMVQSDLKLMQKELLLERNGYKPLNYFE